MTRGKLLFSINSCWNFINFRSGLLRALLADGHEVIAVAPEDDHAEQVRQLGCRLIPVDMARRGTSPIADGKLLASYVRIMARERPDIFLGYTIKPNIYGSIAARRLKIPTINNIAGLGATFADRGWLNRLVRALYRNALSRSCVAFFQNPDDREMFIADRLVTPAQARLLPGSGVDLDRFRPAASDPADASVFLLVSRLLWAKGIGEYADAARIVRRGHPHTSFHLLGLPDEGRDAVDPASLEGWRRDNLVDYLGSVADVRPAIRDAACVVLPTFYPEGTPRALLEAAAMGKPIIATDVPGCRAIVDDGVNGFLCAPRDAEALAAAMVRFLALSPQARAEMGAASRAKAVAEFDERIIIDAYRGAIAEILGRGA